ncbi:MAG: Fic family protein, partial [Mycoplasma sp.]
MKNHKLYYADKLQINDSHKEIDIINKLSNAYPDYEKTGLKLKGNDIYICKTIVEDKINEYISLVDKITNLNQGNKTDHNEKMIRDEIFYSLYIEHESSSRKDISKIMSNDLSKIKKTERRLEINLWNAISYISSYPSIGHGNLRIIYSILTTDIDMGDEALENTSLYRSGNVTIDKYSGIAPELVFDHVDMLFKFLKDSETNDIQNKVFKSILSHFYFEIIHPYYDFNGRTGRLLVYWYGLNNDIKKYTDYFASSLGHYRKQYIRAFNEAQKLLLVDATYAVVKILDILITNKQHYLFVYKINQDVMNKHKRELSTISKSILMKILSIYDIYELDKSSWIKKSSIDEHFKDYQPTTIYNSLDELKKYKIIETTNT